uniref:Zona pellucida sperm-binding protein 4 n=1 Tax=Pantodon buchholzi TaxID=8276 RepID=A0A7R6VNJ7_PANBU|nr:egg envelope protein [Pantodon buchholzi]
MGYQWVQANMVLMLVAAVLAQIKELPGDDRIEREKCHVDEKLPCGGRDIDRAACEAINCCFHESRCFYGKTVTVQCTRDGQFVVVVSRHTTLPHLDVGSVFLRHGKEGHCRPAAVTRTYAVFNFPVTACGTTVKEERGHVVYENMLSSTYEVGIGPRGSITRDTVFQLLFQCRYWGADVLAMVARVNTVPPPLPAAAPGPLRVELRLGSGRCDTERCNEVAAAYTSYYSESDYPVTKVLRQPVFVEVRILGRTDPNIVLLLDKCWATATPNPFTVPQWQLLVHGCPYRDDKYLTTLVPVDASSGLPFPTHYKRFIVRMFTFVDPASKRHLMSNVFIHCSTAVCHPSATDSCAQRCYRTRRDVASVQEESSSETAIVTSGRLILTSELSPSAVKQSASEVFQPLNYGVLAASVSAVLGTIALLFVFWYIRHKRQAMSTNDE